MGHLLPIRCGRLCAGRLPFHRLRAAHLGRRPGQLLIAQPRHQRRIAHLRPCIMNAF